MTVKELKLRTRKDLAGMARVHGVVGWHAMRKADLVQALSRLGRHERRKAARDNGNGDGNGNGSARTVKSTRNGRSPVNGSASHKASQKINGSKQNGRGSGRGGGSGGGVGQKASPNDGPHPSPPSRTLSPKNLAAAGDAAQPASTDRLFVVAHDSYWLHALWELKHSTIKRAEAGLGIEWHAAKPVIRVLDVSSDENHRVVETLVRDVPIHGGINHWYIEVTDPPGVYQLQIGYLTEGGRFFGLARSEIVKTPAPGIRAVLDENWSEIAARHDNATSQASCPDRSPRSDREYRDLRDQLRRPTSSHSLTNFFPGGAEDDHDLPLDLDAELIVYGNTLPNSKVTVAGEQMHLREDGSFALRLSLPDGRQVIPAVVVSHDGSKQQTVVLAIERNTKRLETRHFDGTEL